MCLTGQAVFLGPVIGADTVVATVSLGLEDEAVLEVKQELQYHLENLVTAQPLLSASYERNGLLLDEVAGFQRIAVRFGL